MNKILARIALLAVLAVGVGWAAMHPEALNAAAVEQWVHGFGVWGALVFMAAYAAAAVLFLPGSVLTLAGGALFGPVWGTLYNLVGATTGATLAFLIARYAASDWVTRKTGGRLRQIIEGVEREGWKFVAFVRLVPLFPFNLLNYALGLTRIRLRDFVLASFVFMAPGCLAYTYLGYVGREAAGGGEDLLKKAMLALALLAAVAFLPSFVKRMRQGSAVESPAPESPFNKDEDASAP